MALWWCREDWHQARGFFFKYSLALTETLNFVNRKLRMLLSSSAEITADTKLRTKQKSTPYPEGHYQRVTTFGTLQVCSLRDHDHNPLSHPCLDAGCKVSLGPRWEVPPSPWEVLSSPRSQRKGSQGALVTGVGGICIFALMGQCWAPEAAGSSCTELGVVQSRWESFWWVWHMPPYGVGQTDLDAASLETIEQKAYWNSDTQQSEQ